MHLFSMVLLEYYGESMDINTATNANDYHATERAHSKVFGLIRADLDGVNRLLRVSYGYDSYC